jgi:DNA-binding NarL/FixJ family response regulator
MTHTLDAAFTAVVIDGDDTFADTLSLMLRQELGLRVLAIAGTVESGVAACACHQPSLLVLDTDLLSACGLPILATLAIVSPATAVIMVSRRSPCLECPFTRGPGIPIDLRLSKDLPRDELAATLRNKVKRLMATRTVIPHA